ncbi:MAG TPA: hypothetical protein VFZ73_05405 [Gemmatimonadaceae bacterium]
MVDRAHDEAARPVTRPFVGGRPAAPPAPFTFSFAPVRPFAFSGARAPAEAATRTGSTSVARPQTSPTPLWSVAIYEAGLEHVSDDAKSAQTRADEFAEASIALADGVREAQRHAASLAAAEVLEVVAQRLRRGEILLLPGASTETDAAVVSSVLAALLGGRR